jgi:hypothetical protein
LVFDDGGGGTKVSGQRSVRVAIVLDELMRRYEDLDRRAVDLRRYL